MYRKEEKKISLGPSHIGTVDKEESDKITLTLIHCHASY
jgi:hypothetical protein